MKSAQENIATRLSQLQKIQRRQEEAAARSTAVYTEYQDAKTRSTQAQVKILGEMMKGEPLTKLFLMAAEAIADLTGNQGFKTQCKEGIEQIYASALEDPDAEANEAEKVRARLEKLKAAKERAPEGQYNFIAKAIRQHEAELNRLTAEGSKA